jgi:hypothetical protein
MTHFTIQIANTSDREKLVSEIWLEETLIAEINQESENLQIEIYAGKGKILLPLNEFMEALLQAKQEIDRK